MHFQITFALLIGLVPDANSNKNLSALCDGLDTLSRRANFMEARAFYGGGMNTDVKFRGVDKTGMRFNRLLVVKKAGYHHFPNRPTEKGKAKWECLCDCGKTIFVIGQSLDTGNTKSCGCLNLELYGTRHRKHGMYSTKIYRVWTSMLQRCSNPKDKHFSDYGGRGIKVCERWNNFINFYADMGEPNGLTIERVDNDKGYSPDNCKWATRKEQSRNKRTSHKLTLNGETMTVSEWAIRIKRTTTAIYYRLERGWPIEKVLS